MFMVKDEFDNIKRLLKVKLKIERRTMLWFFAVAATVFLTSLASTIFSLTRSDTPNFRYFNVMDISSNFLIWSVCLYIVSMFIYKWVNNNLSVFPQTNNSRFISTQICHYIFMAVVGLCALVFYFFYYGTIKLVSVFIDNIYFAIEISPGFLLTGYFIFIAYTFLLISIIELVGVILRKWTYYAAVAITAIASLVITNFTAVAEYAPRVLGFILHEQSVAMFMMKAVAVWLAIVAVSVFINNFTVYYKNNGQAKTKRAIFICACISIAILIILPFTIMFNVSKTTESTSEVQSVDAFILDFFADASETRIDISHLPRGSNIALIEGDNINTDTHAGGAAVITGQNLQAFVSGRDSLTNIQGDTLLIQFRPPFWHVNGFELAQHMNPEMTASLIGDTLRIDYNMESANVVILPIWGIAGQFNIFRDRGLVSENLLGRSAGGSQTANIFIRVE